MVISVRRLAQQEHSTALDQLASRISAIMKFGAGADGDPFVKVKDLITDLISRLQAEALSETNQKSYCDEEMSKVTEKKEDLEADVAKGQVHRSRRRDLGASVSEHGCSTRRQYSRGGDSQDRQGGSAWKESHPGENQPV